MNKQVIDLGFILKQIPDSNFSMDGFQDRLKLQKMVYLLQIFDIYLGYNFTWYLRGPYCSVLATNGFALKEFYNDVPNTDIKFQNPRTQERFEEFKKFVKGKDVDELEIAASLHYLKQTCTQPDSEIKNKVVKKQKQFTLEQIDSIWEEMRKCHLL